MGSIGWCINGMPALMPMGIAFNGFFSFTHKHFHTGIIQISLICNKTIVTKLRIHKTCCKQSLQGILSTLQRNRAQTTLLKNQTINNTILL
jgi:hypothetical protein